MGGDYYVELTLGVDKTLALPKGSYIRVTDPTTERAEKYALKRDASPEPISGVNGYKYVLKFYSRQHNMEACQIKWLAGGSEELSFRVTTSLRGFAKLIADNMNKYLGFTDDTEVTDADDAWLYDDTLDDTDMREQSFEGVSCWDAINNIANAFGVEWWIDHGNQLTIRFGKCENEGLVTVIREGEIVNRFPAPKRGDDSNYGTRFYIFGGTQNVPDTYNPHNNASVDSSTYHIAEKRIQLCKIIGDVGNASKTYMSHYDAIEGLNTEQIVERTIILDNVFPKNEETISKISETKEPIIEGEENKAVYYIVRQEPNEKKPNVLSTLGITFTTGALAGRSFDAQWIDATDKAPAQIKIIYTTENSGGSSLLVVPNEYLKPTEGDKYILTGVALGDDSITRAEKELWDKGTELASQYANDTNVYDCPVDPVYCSKEPKVNLALGDKVILKGAHFGEEGRKSRIQGYEKKLYNPYLATYNIGDNTVYSRVAKISKELTLPVALAAETQERKNVQFSAQISSSQNSQQITNIYQRLSTIEGNASDKADANSIPGAKAYADQQANTARLNAIDKAKSDIKQDIKQGIQGVTKFSIVAGTQFVGKPLSVDPNPDVKGIYVATNSVFDNVYGITYDDKLQFNYDPYHQNYDLALKITASDASKYDGAIIGIISDVAAEVLMTQTHLAQGDVIMAVGGSWVKISNTNATSGDGNGQMFGGTIENRATYVVGEPSTQQLWVIPSEEYRTKHKLSSTVTEFEVTDDDFLASDHKGEYFVVKRAGGIVSSFIDGFVWEGVQYDVGDWLVALPYGWKKINGSDVGGSNGVDFEGVKNWVETKLESYAKMPTEHPVQDSILIYDSDNQTFKGSDAQISTTVQDIKNGEDSKIPTCGQVVEFVEETVSNKQGTLISGENIKTVFGQSVLGSGDVLGEFSLGIINTGTYYVESIANARIVRNGVTTPIYINVETHIGNGPSVYVTLSQSGELQVRGTIGGVYLSYWANGTIQEDFIPSTIARTADIKQSDWNEVDSSSNAYINNRTHYFQPYGGYGDLSTYSTSVGENFGPLGEYFSLGGYVYKSSDIVGQEFNCAPYGPSVIVSVVIEAPNGDDNFFLKFVSGTLSPGISIPFCRAGFAKQIDEVYIPNGVARTKDLNVRNVCIVDTEAEIDDTISFATTEYVDTAIATAITTTLNTPV